MSDNVGTLPKGGRTQECLEHRAGQHWPDLAVPLRQPKQNRELHLLADAGPAGGGVHQYRSADPVRIGGSEGPADHAAPRVADEVSPVEAEAVEDVDNTASAITEAEHACQRLT